MSIKLRGRIRVVTKMVLTLAAFTPAFVVYGVILLAGSQHVDGVVFLLVAIALMAISATHLRYATKHAPRIELKPISIEVADNDFVGFMLLCCIPLIARAATGYDWIAFGAVVAVFVLVMTASHMHYHNQLLVLFGWHVYKVDTEEGVSYRLISRDRILTAKLPRVVGRLAEYVLVDKGAKNA